MIVDINIGEYILLMRRRLNLTQEELAKRAGIGRNTLAYTERGDTSPYDRTANLVLEAMGIELGKENNHVEMDN